MALSETLRTELAGHNIGVAVIAPTVFKANLMEDFNNDARGMGRSLTRQMQCTRVTAEQIAEQAFRAIKKNRLYVIPQEDAKRTWWFKRLAPELFSRLIALIYRKRWWVFADIG